MDNYIKNIVFVLLMTFALSAKGQTNPELANTIDSLYQVDQDVQWKYKELHERNAPLDSIKAQEQLKLAAYARHILIIKEIYEHWGYPTAAMVGEEASHHFFVLIQHADSDPGFQKQMLPILDKLSIKKKISRKDYAYLYDRVQRNTGGKQRYGTQPTYGKGGTLFDEQNKIILPPDLEDPRNVDKRRMKVGLEPLEKYYESILELLGRPRKKL
ncbi:MAG: hypothetical protein DI535_15715 [Citrobacter freundii]|nr:MAG: hypothetical protein DI535_15715 [Citrobacter freundii]